MANLALIDLLNRINDGMNDYRPAKCVIEAYLDKPYTCRFKKCYDCIANFLNNENVYPRNNTCVCCGAVIPEGRQVCPVCEMKIEKE